MTLHDKEIHKFIKVHLNKQDCREMTAVTHYITTIRPLPITYIHLWCTYDVPKDAVICQYTALNSEVEKF